MLMQPTLGLMFIYPNIYPYCDSVMYLGVTGVKILIILKSQREIPNVSYNLLYKYTVY